MLGRLVEQGIVRVERVGPSYVHRLNRDHLAAPHVVALAGLRQELFERLRERLAGWEPPPVFAAMFGSAARGDMRPDSDIDLLIVRPDGVDADDDRWVEQVSTLVRGAGAWTGNDVRPLEFADSEVRDGLHRRVPVLEAVRREGVHLAGPAGHLTAGRAKAAGARRGGHRG